MDKKRWEDFISQLISDLEEIRDSEDYYVHTVEIIKKRKTCAPEGCKCRFARVSPCSEERLCCEYDCIVTGCECNTLEPYESDCFFAINELKIRG